MNKNPTGGAYGVGAQDLVALIDTVRQRQHRNRARNAAFNFAVKIDIGRRENDAQG